MNRSAAPKCDVLHVTQPTGEGVGKVVRQLIRDQLSAGLRVALAAPTDAALQGPLSEIGCECFGWEAVRSPRKGLWGESRRIREIVEQSRPKVVHAHSSKAGLVTRLALRRQLPTFFHPNGWSFRVGPSWMRRAAFAFEIHAARHWTSQLLCVSQSEVDALEGKVDESLIQMIPNGIDLNRWNELGNRSKSQARSELGLPQDAPLAVAASRVTRQKGPDLMVQMWPSIREACPTAQLIWVGEGEELEGLAAKTSSDDSIHFLGVTDNPKIYFEAADVVVMPSRWEGHSLSMLESLATGRPVVAFDVEGMAETITSDVGAVVPVHDLKGFAREVQRFFGHNAEQQEQVAALAKQRILDHYDLQQLCAKIRTLYEQAGE